MGGTALAPYIWMISPAVRCRPSNHRISHSCSVAPCWHMNHNRNEQSAQRDSPTRTSRTEMYLTVRVTFQLDVPNTLARDKNVIDSTLPRNMTIMGNACVSEVRPGSVSAVNSTAGSAQQNHCPAPKRALVGQRPFFSRAFSRRTLSLRCVCA